MKKITFSTIIHAPKERVWEILWNKNTYEQWAGVFSEGSTVETDWKEGGKVHFLDGHGEGMYSVIEKLIPNEYMSFKHLGMVSDGKESPFSEEYKGFSGSMENYTLTESNRQTILVVEVDVEETYQEYFDEQFPKALEALKQLAEK